MVRMTHMPSWRSPRLFPLIPLLTALLMVASCGSSQPGRANTAHGVNATKIPKAVPAESTTTTPAAPDLPPSRAVSPRSAVETYLSSEISDDGLASYNVLSSADRSSIGSFADWTTRHASMPRYLSYTILGVIGPSVVTDVNMTPRVDESNGVVPASARVTWTAVSESGGWTVALSTAKFDPRYPDPALAKSAALGWVAAAQAGSTANQYEGNLLGQPDIAQQLRSVTGSFAADDPVALKGNDLQGTITDTFGPDAVLWAHVVHLRGPVGLDVATAPLGDQWVVIAIKGT